MVGSDDINSIRRRVHRAWLMKLTTRIDEALGKVGRVRAEIERPLGEVKAIEAELNAMRADVLGLLGHLDTTPAAGQAALEPQKNPQRRQGTGGGDNEGTDFWPHPTVEGDRG